MLQSSILLQLTNHCELVLAMNDEILTRQLRKTGNLMDLLPHLW